MDKKSKWIKNWFSNMEPFDTPMVRDKIVYRTVENFYQAMKIPKEEFGKRMLIAAMNPFQAKKHIRDKNEFYWRYDWNDKLKLEVMEYALRYKFAIGTSWFFKLMETGNEEIVEWNNWGDVFYGKDIITKQGENHLGKILMKIRDEYKNQ